ncbi:MAG: heavy-metal-associated domain-containing protein [Deltaproteobacteria bacterium]|nr:heavy-metal-associated domain-containing protein [Deltaproteobacteria bacterium]
MMKSLLLTLLGIFLLGTATVGAEEKVATPQDTKTVHMKIEGMTCPMCSAMIQKKLTPLCQAVSIDHKNGEGQCTYEASKTSQDSIVKAVADAGYKVVETH